MTTEQIMQAVGCTEEQARDLQAHIQTSAVRVEQGTITTIQRTIAHCPTCGKRQWHDGQTCIVCGERR